MNTRHHLCVFVSSPSDVLVERKKVVAVIQSLNRQIGDSYNITLEAVGWESHVVPGMGRPQEVINRQIDDYDIFVGIMWKRFGTKTGKAGSGTEEEFKIAYKKWQSGGRPHILFYFSQVPYTVSTEEEHSQIGKVIRFKRKAFGKKGLCCEYKTIDEFEDQLRIHLTDVIRKRFTVQISVDTPADFTTYLKYLRSETMYIDIRGLVSGEAKAHQFVIDELYLPLKTGSIRQEELTKESQPCEILLQEALKNKQLVIKGEPGSGKTTFMRLLSYTLCQKWLGESIKSNLHIDWPEPPPLPLFIRLGRFAEFLLNCREQKKPGFPAHDDNPQCLLQYLEQMNQDFKWNLPADAFSRELAAGRCLILLDGLDEAPDRKIRQAVSDLAANLFKTWPDCPVVLTSRPVALTDKAVPQAFDLVEIAALDEPAIADFFQKWTTALYPKAPEKAAQYRRELSEALQSRPDILRMAVMKKENCGMKRNRLIICSSRRTGSVNCRFQPGLSPA